MHQIVEADFLQLIGRDIGGALSGLRIGKPGRRPNKQGVVGTHKELTSLER